MREQDDPQLYSNGMIWCMMMSALIVIGLCSSYIINLQNLMKRESGQYLAEVAEQSVRYVNDQLGEDFRILESAAGICATLEHRTGEVTGWLPYLEEIAGSGEALRVGAVNAQGHAWISGGIEWDLAGENAIQRALNGERSISQKLILPADGIPVFLLTVPVWQGEQPAGAAILIKSAEELARQLEIQSFHGQGHSHIVDRSGSYIISDEEPGGEEIPFFEYLEQDGSADPGYSLEQMRRDMQEGRSGVYYGKLNGTHLAVLYQPIQWNGWYMINSFLLNEVTGNYQAMLWYGVLVIGAVAAVFVALFLFFRRTRKKYIRELKELAFTDPVTGGGNDVKFRIEAEKACRKAPPQTYAFVSVDLQAFKLINEEFGVEEGDRVLRYMYNIFARNLTDGEYMTRMEADRFKLLLKNAPRSELRSRLEKIAVEMNSYNHLLNRTYYMRLNAGVCVVDDPGANIIILRDLANMMRKKSKNTPSGKFLQCEFYEREERVRLLKAKDIMDQMGCALQNREFRVYLQPKVELATGKIAGAEALVRWQRAEQSIFYPDEFIPVLEKSGLITELDLYMFREVCSLERKWIEEKRIPIPVSVNFSRVNLHVSDILKKYREIWERSGVPSQLLEIELTESMIGSNMDYIRNMIVQIHEAGFRCSIDDYGSGYSSMNMLKELLVDTIKLDKAFLNWKEDPARKKRAAQIIASSIDLIHGLGMKVVAEGVETREQVQMLADKGCDMIQGYYYSKPVPVEEFEKMMEQVFEI